MLNVEISSNTDGILECVYVKRLQLRLAFSRVVDRCFSWFLFSLQAQFDCSISLLHFSSEELAWMIAMWSGAETGGVEKELAVPRRNSQGRDQFCVEKGKL